jgi:hypothetical protein
MSDQPTPLDLDAMRARARETTRVKALLNTMVLIPDESDARRVARTNADAVLSAYDALADEVERLQAWVDHLMK